MNRIFQVVAGLSVVYGLAVWAIPQGVLEIVVLTLTTSLAAAVVFTYSQRFVKALWKERLNSHDHLITGIVFSWLIRLSVGLVALFALLLLDLPAVPFHPLWGYVVVLVLAAAVFHITAPLNGERRNWLGVGVAVVVGLLLAAALVW